MFLELSIFYLCAFWMYALCQEKETIFLFFLLCFLVCLVNLLQYLILDNLFSRRRRTTTLFAFILRLCWSTASFSHAFFYMTQWFNKRINFYIFFFHLNCRIKSWTIQLVLLLDLLVLVLLHLGLVFWIPIWVLVLQLWALKILVQLSHQNLKKWANIIGLGTFYQVRVDWPRWS
jgi:hypothetical protein